MKQSAAEPQSTPASLKQTLSLTGRQQGPYLALGLGVCLLLLAGTQLSAESRNQTLLESNAAFGAIRRAHQQLGQAGFQVTQLFVFGLKNQPTTQSTAVVAEAKALQSRVAQLEAENESLRAQLDLPVSDQSRISTARIASIDQKLLEYPVQLQPKVGQLVIRDGVLLGRIIEVVGQRARVELVTDKSFPSLVVQTSQGTSGLLLSQKGVTILTQVPSHLPLAQDDVVVTSDQLLAPSGLTIGTLRGVQLDSTGSVQTAIVLPAALFGSAAEVQILEWPT